jgi:hypothetical protein
VQHFLICEDVQRVVLYDAELAWLH